MKKNNNKKAFDGKNIFLTYSRCPISNEEMFDYFQKFFEEKKRKITYIGITSEDHKDEKEKHLHLLIQLDKRFQTRDSRFFDIKKPQSFLGSLFKTFNPKKHEYKDYFWHPNIKPEPGESFDTLKMRNYLLKIDEPERRGRISEYGEFKVVRYIRLSKDEKETELDKLTNNYFFKLREEYKQKKININKTKAEIFKKLKIYAESLAPNYAYKNTKRFKNMAYEHIYEPEIIEENEIYSFWTFKKLPILVAAFNILKKQKEQLLSSNFRKRLKTIIGEGNSKSGKTEFFQTALTDLDLLFNHIMDDIDFSSENYDEDKIATIFDDIDIHVVQKRNLTKAVIGNHKESLVNMKYKPRMKIKGPKISIVVVNEGESIEQYCVENKKRGRKEYKYLRENGIYINFDKHTITTYERGKYEDKQKIVQYFEIPKDYNGLLYYTEKEQFAIADREINPWKYIKLLK
jgi:hypothetical protein